METDLMRFNRALLACTQRYPNQRIGQIIDNAVQSYAYEIGGTPDLFYKTDSEICVALESYAKK